MKLTKEYLKSEVSRVNALLVSGSLHEIDEASHITARLIEELND